ncbi:hypothetical protein HANVADRAFT_1626 [Hanseniaspora valbyensis NRRL Y-1626]|uniref:MFS general substrate transporter n=1 Tax=Hanseniaspora valbyensis NRRL Y-1626 TaxID=766949 RepID=A0A1B7TG72_9ASCO|nr:hypothetical protein HANVADRAFT_1626 [Hanseniaspora valbyensis NRRL Y-1626]
MSSLAQRDKPQFYLLVILYFLQGLPCGLTYGSVPFLLKTLTISSISDTKALSFTQIGVFSMATYPYSFKILWSPIIDSFYSKKIGRRRSWIIPLQFLISFIFLILSFSKTIIGLQSNDINQITLTSLTFCFLLLIFCCSTQDIAVDGWALEILSEESLSFASTAQTIGLNLGYFTSFTLFLNLRSGKFFTWQITINQYLKVCAVIYFLTTLYIMFFTRENLNPSNGFPKDLEKSPNGNKDEKERFLITDERNEAIMVETTAVCNDSATNLRLLDKGFKSENLAISVLINFPFELCFGYYVGKWSSQNNSKNTNTQYKNKLLKFLLGEYGCLAPWLFGFLGRLIFGSLLGNLVVYLCPNNLSTESLPMWYFLLVIFQNLVNSLMSTFQFVSICSFHTQIADPTIGGTYITLLNTFSNLGGTWPKVLVLKMVDYFTVKTIVDGKDVIVKDGYYRVNFISICVGIILYFKFLKKSINKLQKLPKYVWRKKSSPNSI